MLQLTQKKHSLLDLIFTSDPDMIDSVNALGTFGSSDHNMLQWDIKVGTTQVHTSRSVLDYTKGNFAAMRSELSRISWIEVLQGNTEQKWAVFKGILDDQISRHIPRKIIAEGQKRKPQWLSYKAVKLVKRKHQLYAKYKNCKHPAYMRAARDANIKIRRSKRRFEMKLAANIKDDVKSFYAYVSSKRKAKPRVGPIVTENGDMVSSPSCIAGLLNDDFSSVFTKENTDFFPTARSSLVINNVKVLTDISFTEEAVWNKLDSLKEDKSGGPDDLPPRLLKIIKDEIYIPLTAIFQCSLNEGIVPMDWHMANVSPCTL